MYQIYKSREEENNEVIDFRGIYFKVCKIISRNYFLKMIYFQVLKKYF